MTEINNNKKYYSISIIEPISHRYKILKVFDAFGIQVRDTGSELIYEASPELSGQLMAAILNTQVSVHSHEYPRR